MGALPVQRPSGPHVLVTSPPKIMCPSEQRCRATVLKLCSLRPRTGNKSICPLTSGASGSHSTAGESKLKCPDIIDIDQKEINDGTLASIGVARTDPLAVDAPQQPVLGHPTKARLACDVESVGMRSLVRLVDGRGESGLVRDAARERRFCAR